MLSFSQKTWKKVSTWETLQYMEAYNNIDLNKIRYKSMNWIYLALDRDHWLPLVDTVMNFRVS